MAVSVIGEGAMARAVAAALASCPGDWTWIGPGDPDFAATQARVALRHGRPVLMYWPPSLDPAEGDVLVRIAEEAGVELGIARPFRLVPDVRAPLQRRPYPFVAIQALVASPAALPLAAQEVLDLALTLAGGGDVQRAERELSDSVAALAVRLPRGAFAQVLVGVGEPERIAVLAVSGREAPLRLDFSRSAAQFGTEVHVALALEFERSVAERRPAPSSLHDALPALRLLGRR